MHETCTINEHVFPMKKTSTRGNQEVLVELNTVDENLNNIPNVYKEDSISTKKKFEPPRSNIKRSLLE